MSEDKYYKRLEELFSQTEVVDPDPTPIPPTRMNGPEVSGAYVGELQWTVPGALPQQVQAPEEGGPGGAVLSALEQDRRGTTEHPGHEAEAAFLVSESPKGDMGRASTIRYASLGVCFGLLFPVLATVAVLLRQGAPFALSSLVQAQLAEPLLWIIDMAPLVLGLFGVHAGRRDDRLEHVQAETSSLLGRLEHELEARSQDLEIAAEIGRRVARLRGLDELLADSVEIIRQRFGLYHAQIYLVDPTGRSLTLTASTGEVGAKLLEQGHRLSIGPGSINGVAASERRPVIVGDTSVSEIHRHNPLLPDTRSEAAVPLIAGERLVGVLDLQSAEPHAWAEADLPVYEALAGTLAVSIENASSFAEKQRALANVEAQTSFFTRTGWQEYLNALERDESASFTHELETPSTAAEPTDPTMEGQRLVVPIQIAGEAVGSIELESEPGRTWEEDEVELARSVANQIAQRAENLRLLADAERQREVAEEATRRLTREGWVGYLEGKEGGAAYQYDLNRVVSISSLYLNGDEGQLVRPLKIRDEDIGRLIIAEADGDEGWARELVEAVAEQLESHIENLRLSEQSRKRAAELETVAEVSTAVSSFLEARQLLQGVVELVRISFGLYHAHVYLLDEESETLALAAGAGDVGRKMVDQGWSIPLNRVQSLVARAARTRQGVISNDVRQAPDYLPNPLLPDTRSEMAIPLLMGEKLLGVLDVQSDRANRFTDEDVKIQTTLAAQVAVALQNATLYAEQEATVHRLQELDHLKTSFLANMSHELRTPLNSVLGFTDIMIEGLDGPLTEQMETDLKVIRKNGRHLLNLINDVLDMAKIEAGRMNLAPEFFNLTEVLHEVKDILEPLAHEKSLELLFETDVPEDLNLVADRMRLRQVLLNLVGNAIKFTEKGSVVVRATKEDGSLMLAVQDTGIGIPADKTETIFEAFSQVDPSPTRKVGGTGLGLPISRQLIELHEGRLWVESSGKPGEGSTFHIELPMQTSLEQDQG